MIRIAIAGYGNLGRGTENAVLAAEDLELVAVDLGERDGMRYGLPMTVIRDGRPVARVRVVDVRERMAGAVVEDTSAGAYPREGDRAVPTRTADSEGT